MEKLPTEFEDFEILQLSDLHSKEFGKNNKRLLDKIYRVDPDIIVITGDMMSNTSENDDTGEVLLTLLEGLDGKYLIYYVTGEHEEGKYYEDRNKYQKPGTKEANEEQLAQLGVEVLNDEHIEIKRGSSALNLYGLKEHLSGDINISGRLNSIDTNEVNILLSQRPFYFEEYAQWGADIIFSGDTHGGMIRIPFIGGVFSTEGFFPKYDGGIFHDEKSTMIVSRGLGNNPIPLRIFNRPELVIVNIKSD